MTEESRKTLDDVRAMLGATISNSLAAEVLGMSPDRLAEYAKRGDLGWNTIVSGNTVKHSREGFIKYWEG